MACGARRVHVCALRDCSKGLLEQSYTLARNRLGVVQSQQNGCGVSPTGAKINSVLVKGIVKESWNCTIGGGDWHLLVDSCVVRTEVLLSQVWVVSLRFEYL